MHNFSVKAVVGLLTVGLAASLTGLSTATAGEAKPGKAQYDKLCTSCHGADGKGNPAMAKAMGEKGLNLTTKEVKEAKDEDLLKVIVEGKGKMPASGKGLSKSEQKEVLEYVRSLGK
jgi:cytochrome c oxidase cbb3-type subunit III